MRRLVLLWACRPSRFADCSCFETRIKKNFPLDISKLFYSVGKSFHLSGETFAMTSNFKLHLFKTLSYQNLKLISFSRQNFSFVWGDICHDHAKFQTTLKLRCHLISNYIICTKTWKSSSFHGFSTSIVFLFTNPCWWYEDAISWYNRWWRWW